MVIKKLKFGAWFHFNEDKGISYVFVESGFDNMYHVISETPEAIFGYQQMRISEIQKKFGELEQ